MIEFATADLTGCIITTDTGTTRATTWRNAHAETVKVSQVSNFSKESQTTDSAFLICTDAEPWIYTRAMHELISEGKKLTMMKLARRIQKHELANLKVTGAPKEMRDGESVYDGTAVTRDDLGICGSTSGRKNNAHLAPLEDRERNWIALPGSRGFHGTRISNRGTFSNHSDNIRLAFESGSKISYKLFYRLYKTLDAQSAAVAKHRESRMYRKHTCAQPLPYA